MKLTININLGGYAFHIDDDAYELLQNYLKSLEREFSGEESSAEIISDIEGRLAELFRARLNSYKQVITLTDVQDVIAVLGSPEAISGSDAEEKIPHASRRIYRDPDNRMLGGVCAGLASWFNTNMWLIRAIFVLLLFGGGFGLLLYIILWILLPEAKTTAQKIEMRGEPVNIENIKESVKREFNTVKKKMNL
jgi:phage shock protein PspC (stress-responsive transcriptional regulator)